MNSTRGRTKIEQAVAALHFDFRKKIVLDIGSSTGGFSEYALEKGASKVIAIEKGTKQMMAPLRFDSRIELHEKKDIFEVSSKKELAKNEPRDRKSKVGVLKKITIIDEPDVILADVSFVSLKKVLIYAKNEIAGDRTQFLVMLKPQFEARPTELLRGVVKNEKMRRNIIKDFEQFLKRSGFLILGKHDNELSGKTGNKERFYLLGLSK